MNTHRRILTAVGILALSGSTMAARAQTDSRGPAPAQVIYITNGDVEIYADGKLSVKAENGKSMTFRVETTTKVSAPLQKGDRVRVEWKEAAGDERVAVVVSPAKKPSEGVAAG